MGSPKCPERIGNESANYMTTEFISSILHPILSPVRSVFRGGQTEDSDIEASQEHSTAEVIEPMHIDFATSDKILITEQTSIPVHKALREKNPKLGDWPASTPPETNDFEVFCNKQRIGSPSKNPNPVLQPPLIRKINWDNIPKLSPSQLYYPTIDEKEDEGNAYEQGKMIKVENNNIAKQETIVSIDKKDTSAELHSIRKLSSSTRVAATLTPTKKSVLVQRSSPGDANKQCTFWDEPLKFRTTKPKRGSAYNIDKSLASDTIVQNNLDGMDVDLPGDETIDIAPQTSFLLVKPETSKSATVPMTPANAQVESSLFGTHRMLPFFESTSFSPLDSEEIRRTEASQGATGTGKGKEIPEKMLPDTPIPKRYQNVQGEDEEDEEDEESNEDSKGEDGSEFMDNNSPRASEELAPPRAKPVPTRKATKRNKVDDSEGKEEEEKATFLENEEISKDDDSMNFIDDEDLEEKTPPKKKQPAARKPRARPKTSKGYKPDSDDESDDEASEEFSPQPKKTRRKPRRTKAAPKAEKINTSEEIPSNLLPPSPIENETTDSIDLDEQIDGEKSTDGEGPSNIVDENTVQPPVQETKRQEPAKQRKRKRNSDEAFKPDGADSDSDSNSVSDSNLELDDGSENENTPKTKRRKTTNETDELQKELHDLYDGTLVVEAPSMKGVGEEENGGDAEEQVDEEDTADKTPKQQTELFSAYNENDILAQTPLHGNDFNMGSFIHPLQTSTSLPPARVAVSNDPSTRAEESSMMAYELEHPEYADPTKENTRSSFQTVISNSNVTDLGEETLKIQSEEDEDDGFSYVYKPPKHQVALRSFFSPNNTFDTIIGLHPLEVEKQHIRVPVGQPITSALHSPSAAIRRELVSTLTFSSNVQLVKPGKEYIFRCCLCKELSDVKLQFYHEELTWSDQLCLNCYSHNCCRRCERYQRDVPVPKHSQNRDPKTDDYEEWLRAAKKAYNVHRGVNDAFDKESDEKENVAPQSSPPQQSKPTLRNATRYVADNGGNLDVNWQAKKEAVYPRRGNLAEYYRDPFSFGDYIKGPI